MPNLAAEIAYAQHPWATELKSILLDAPMRPLLQDAARFDQPKDDGKSDAGKKHRRTPESWGAPILPRGSIAVPSWATPQSLRDVVRMESYRHAEAR